MNLCVMVIDDSLGDLRFVRQLLETIDGVASVLVAAAPLDQDAEFEPDVVIVGPRWLNWARNLRETYPECFIIGRCPWQGELEGEFFPWGNQLREPSIPLPNLLPFAS